jgi:hypothetical protein
MVTPYDAGGVGEARQPVLLQVALDNAHARSRRVEQENAQLHRELGEVHAAQDLSGEHGNQLTLSHRSNALARVRRPPHRWPHDLPVPSASSRCRTMTWRLRASWEADVVRTQNGQLRERIDHLRLEVDQCRRALSARPPVSR